MCGDPALFGEVAGMYAAATWRADTGSLWLARDRMGEKPLYVVQTNTWLAFASELKALVAVGLLERDLDPDAMALFLRLGNVPEPWTIYQKARPLAAGLVIEITRRGEQRTHLSLAPRDLPSRLHGEPVDLRSTVIAAVDDAMIADVPTGIFLSGGLDSSVIATAAAKSHHHPVTLTLSAPQWADDEAAEAAQTARYLGLTHSTVTINPTRALDDFVTFFRAMDEPTVDGFNSFLIAKAGREAGLTVALSGLGGDELFRGYSTFADMSRLRRIQHLPGLASAASLLGRVGWRPMVAERIADVAHARSRVALYVARRGVFGSRTSDDILGRNVDWGLLFARLPQVPDDIAAAGDDPVTGWLETVLYLRNQLLRDVDVFSMANSLEVRAPLLLPDVVAFGLGMKNDARLRGKAALRDAFQDDLPPGVLHRSKRGFGLPWDAWLRDDFAARVRSALLESHFSRTYFHPPAVSRLLADFAAHRAHWSTLWAPTVLCMWDEAQRRPVGGRA
jgi:asparagine synthase (glutamine-hydrolysing)